MNLEKALREENVKVEFIYHSFQTVPAGFYPLGKSFTISFSGKIIRLFGTIIIEKSHIILYYTTITGTKQL